MTFPKWAYNAEYLPSLEDLNKLPKLWNGNFDDFIHHNPLWTPFQVINKEFIDWLSNEIINKINKINKEKITILEVGAWNGRLSYFLSKEINILQNKKKVDSIITDDYSWFNKDDENPYFYMKKIDSIKIENYNYEEAIDKFQPDIIISSWMPLNEDWTKKFRESESVENFILIWTYIDCWTVESWDECDNFEWQEISIKWNLTWRSISTQSDFGSSKIVIFNRKKAQTRI